VSSIYKKGRDGYYYYQAYTYNNLTKKKDKRIYHALGTKDGQEAIQKQKELDLKYEKVRTILDLSFLSFFYKKKYFISIFMIFSITYYINTIFNKSIYSKEIIYRGGILKDKLNIPDENIVIPNIVNVKADENNEKFTQNDFKNIKSKDINLELDLTDIPKYKIIRTEKISDIFNQIKIFITINNQVNSIEKLKLCKSIVKKYKGFSNITIFLFADSQIGRLMANERDLNISTKERQKSWLVMYSSNPVEGEYFDDKPTEYLGFN
jgi:hypothetical protein